MKKNGVYFVNVLKKKFLKFLHVTKKKFIRGKSINFFRNSPFLKTVILYLMWKFFVVFFLRCRFVFSVYLRVCLCVCESFK